MCSSDLTIDYVVTKMPRFTFEKFPGAASLLGTSMKSVGEAMAIGRNFQESLQKAFRSMETGLNGLNPVELPGVDPENVDPQAVRRVLAEPTPDRLLRIAQAFRLGLTVEEINAACHYDPWFLRQVKAIIDVEAEIGRAHV
mgnify:FL=1